MMQLIKVEVNPNTRIRDEVSPRVMLGTTNTVVRAMIEAITQHLVRSVQNAGKRTILKLCVKAMVLMKNEIKAGLGLRKARRAKSSMKLMRQMIMVWMI